MKALKDCKWEVQIWKQRKTKNRKPFFWYCKLIDFENAGVIPVRLVFDFGNYKSFYDFDTEEETIQNFKEWAELNEIKNYEING
jgi:hypothetical protein